MSDPLALLREYVTANQAVTRDGDDIVIGVTRVPRDTKTAFKSRKGEFYNIDALWFYLEHRHLQVGDYVKACKANNVQVVGYLDKKPLVEFLEGKVESVRNVDYDGWKQLYGDIVLAESAVKKRKADEPVVELDGVQNITTQEFVINDRLSCLNGRKDLSSILSTFDTVSSKKKQKRQNEKDPKSNINPIPIVIVPNALSSLINLYNVKEFLQDGRFVPVNEKRDSGMAKPEHVTIKRPSMRDGTQTAKFLIIDDPKKLSKTDWKRVIAVFASGAKWQFADWPFESPAEIFEKAVGFHLHFSDSEPAPNITSWNVRRFKLHRSRRHTDKSVMLDMWSDIGSFLETHSETSRHLTY